VAKEAVWQGFTAQFWLSRQERKLTMRKRNYVGRIMKGFVRGLVVLLVLSVGLGEAITEVRAANPGIEPNTIEVLPYQASAYRFLVIDSDSTPPSGFEQPGFDDNAFNTGDAALAPWEDAP
jgi:hypothetical protein